MVRCLLHYVLTLNAQRNARKDSPKMTDSLREAHRVYQQLRRAQESGLPATLTLDEWLQTINQFGGLCAYCLEAPFDSMDHLLPVTHGGGTVVENCVPVCNRCNSRKSGRIAYQEHGTDSFIQKVEQVRTVLSNSIRIPQ